MDCIARFFRVRGRLLLVLAGVAVLGGCVQAKLLKYSSFQNREYSSRAKPAEVQQKTTAELLSGGYLLIGYIDLRRNVRTCYEDNSCVNHSDKPPEPGELQQEAAAKGGDVVTVLEERTILEKNDKSVCTRTTTTYIYVNKQMIPQTICASSVQIAGRQEAKISRALVWRHDPVAANSDANANAIEAALKAVEKTYAEDEKRGTPSAQAKEGLDSAAIRDGMQDDALSMSIYRAIAHNDQLALETLDREGKLRSWEDGKKRSPLMVALFMNYFDAARTLLVIDKGLARRDDFGLSALDYALARAELPLIKEMLAAGYDLRSHSIHGGQPQFHAAINRDPEVMPWIEAQGFDPKAKTKDDQTTLMFAAEAGNEVAVRRLAGMGIGIEEKNRDQRTALMLAAMEGSLPATKALLELGANPKLVDNFGNNAAHFAAHGGNLEVLKLMLDAKIDFSAHNSKQLSVLGVAIASQRWAVADFLLDRKHTTVMPGLKPGAAASFMIEKNQPGTLQRYLVADPKLKAEMLRDPEWLQWAAKVSGEQTIKLFQEMGVDLNRPGADGTPPLVTAAENGNLETLRALLELKANPQAVDGKGQTALRAATMAGKADAVSVLREFGVAQ